MGGVTDQIVSLFKTKDYSQPKRVETVHEDGKKPSKYDNMKYALDNANEVVDELFESFFSRYRIGLEI